MSITYIPQERNTFGSDLLQMAIKIGIEKKLQDERLKQQLALQQQQDQIQRANEWSNQVGTRKMLQQYMPNLFTPDYQQATQAQGSQMNIAEGLPLEQQRQLYQAKYPNQTIPSQYMKLNLQEAQKYPGLDLEKMGLPYKVSQASSPTVGVYTTTPEGIPQRTGEVPKGSRVLTPAQMETPPEKLQRSVETQRLQKAEAIRAESQSVDNMVDTVWKASDKLIPAPEKPKEAEKLGVQRGLKTMSIGGFRPQRMMGITDENALAFDQIKRGEATPLIRALGEKGMLTNQDIERAYNLMPHFSDTQKLRTTKREELRKFLKSRVDAYYQQPTQESIQQPNQIGRFTVEVE